MEELFVVQAAVRQNRHQDVKGRAHEEVFLSLISPQSLGGGGGRPSARTVGGGGSLSRLLVAAESAGGVGGKSAGPFSVAGSLAE